MGAALGDAAWMVGMERNSDLIIMASHAPLFVNVNKGGMQWVTDLIGYDTMTSYGSPSYYAKKVFSLYHGDDVVSIAARGVPTKEWQPPAGRGFAPPPQAAAGPGPRSRLRRRERQAAEAGVTCNPRGRSNRPCPNRFP